MDQVTTHLGVDAADELLLESESQTLKYTAGRGFRDPATVGTSFHLSKGLPGRSAREGRILNSINPTADTCTYRPALAGEDFVEYYCAPLTAKGENKGVLEVFHRQSLEVDEEWLTFLQTLTGQTAIAVDSAQLFDRLQHSNVELRLSYEATIESLAQALELRDGSTERHSERVAEMTVELARSMGISGNQLTHIRHGALLHDIGKIGISDGILLRPGPLTEEEWKVMRRHPTYGYELLSKIDYLRPALNIPYCHHEKWDGSGYPRGLQGEEIPLEARIFAIVDVWEALSSDRPYSKAWPAEKIIRYLQENSGLHFDPQVVEIFLEFIS